MKEPKPWGNLSPDEIRIAQELGFTADDLNEPGDPKDLNRAAAALFAELEDVASPPPAGAPTGKVDPANAAKIAAAWVCIRCGAQACLELPTGDFQCGKDLGGCGRELQMRSFKWRRGPNNEPIDVVISSKIVMRAALRLKSMLNADSEFPRIAEEAEIPKNLWPALKAHVELLYTASNGAWLQLDSNRRITFTDTSIDITVVSQRADDKVYPVIAKPFDVVRRIRIKDKVVATVRDQGGEFSGTLPEIRTRLDHNQQILNHRDVADVLGHVLSQVPIISRGQFTYGVYVEGDKLSLPEFIIPKNDFQTEAVNAILPHLQPTATGDDWQAYADFFAAYNAYEWMPVAGLAAIAPFTPILRAAKVISPAIMLLGEKGIGKSSIAEALSRKLWAQELLSANDMGTEFRLPAFLDSIAAVLVVDDAENFKWHEFGGYLKKSLESIRGASRGTGARTKDDFLNLASLVFTANYMPHLSASLLARFLIIEFDDSRLTLPAQVRRKFAALEKQLKTIGPLITRAGLEMCNGSMSKFQDLLEREIQPNIEAAKKGRWSDNRRAVVWSVIYLGLRFLHKVSNGKVPLPTFEAFVQDVIDPVERMTQQATMDPLVLLREYIQVWESTKTQRSFESNGREGITVETVQGEGKMLLTDVWEEPRIPGHWVTAAFLGMYNGQNVKRVEAQIPDLARLARLVAKRYPVLRLELLVDKNGDAKAKKFGSKSMRAVFVPAVDPDHIAQRPLGEAVNGNGSNGGDAAGSLQGFSDPTESTAIDRTLVVLDAIRTHPNAAAGVPADVVLATAQGKGVNAEAAQTEIDRLLRAGQLYQPRWGLLSVL